MNTPDRYAAQLRRQKLMKAIDHAETMARRYSDHDSRQSRLWLNDAEKARAELKALSPSAE